MAHKGNKEQLLYRLKLAEIEFIHEEVGEYPILLLMMFYQNWINIDKHS